MVSKRKAAHIITILMSVFCVWYVLLVMAVVMGTDQAWNLVKWSPTILVPWAAWDVARTFKR